jgi:hypothetical protein
VGVYGSNVNNDKRVLWDELVGILVGGIYYGVLGVI